MKSDGTVDFEQEISNSQGGFTGTLLSSANFGNDITAMGHIDGDGVPDIAVASAFDDDGGNNRGSVWILFMYSNGMVKSHAKITGGQGGFTGTVSNGDRFGSAISTIGDLNGDGFTDLAVGSQLDNAGGAGRGAVWILFLDGTGTVISHQKISDVDGGFTGVLDDNDRFAQVTAIGDLNGDNIMDIAVGASLDDDGGSNIGAIWILFLDTDGMVLGHQKISATQGNFGGVLAVDDRFSNSTEMGYLTSR